MKELCCLEVKSDVWTATSKFDGEYGIVPWKKHNDAKFGVFDLGKAAGVFDLCFLLSFYLQVATYEETNLFTIQMSQFCPHARNSNNAATARDLMRVRVNPGDMCLQIREV